MPINVDIVPRGSLVDFGRRDTIDTDGAYKSGTSKVDPAAPYKIQAERAKLLNETDLANTAMKLRPLEAGVRKKQLEAESADIDELSARERYVKKGALDLKSLSQDLEKVLFPKTAAAATANADTAVNEASLGAMRSGVMVQRAKDITDAVAGEIANVKAKVALESAQLVRLKDDPMQLKEQLAKKLIDMGIPFDQEESADSMFAKWSTGYQEAVASLERIAQIKAGSGADSDRMKSEAELRKEFVGSPVKQRYDIVTENVAKVRATAGKPDEQTTASDDLATIFSYMKILDPGSTVREGEFATAQNAAGIAERVRNLYNKVATGERLAPGQRQNFLRTSEDLAKSQQIQFDRHKNFYRRIAERTGLGADNIVGDTVPGTAPMPATDTEKPAPADAVSGRKRITLKSGRVVFGHVVRNPKTGTMEVEIEETAK